MARAGLRTLLASVCFFLTTSGIATAQEGFHVEGSKIYDPAGREFIAKGVNINGIRWIWPGIMTRAEHLLKIVNGFKFNAVRVPVSFKASEFDDNTVEDIVAEYTSRGIVVIFDAHDKGGSYYEGTELDTVKDFFRDLATTYKNNPYVWINVQNEPGDNTLDRERWLRVHREIIRAVRDEAKADNIIVCDGSAFGQDVGELSTGPVKTEKSAILSYGKDLLSFGGKSYKNIIFSIHAYEQWSQGTPQENRAKMEDFIERANAQGLALIIGEYGVQRDTHNTWRGTQGVIAAAQRKEIGRIVWSWWGGDANDLTNEAEGGGHMIDSIISPTNLTELGKLVWEDNRREEDLSDRPPVVTPTPTPTPTASPTPTPGVVITAVTGIYEAESAKVRGSMTYNSYPGYSGQGYVLLDQGEGRSIEWLLTAPKKKSHRLSIRFSNGSPRLRALRVSVNGKAVDTLRLSPTGGWSKWKEIKMQKKVALKKGRNKVKILGSGTSSVHIDLLKVR